MGLGDKVVKEFSGKPYEFGVCFFPEYFRIRGSLFHVEVLSAAMEYSRLAIAAPRESSKSTILGFLYQIYCICFKRKRFLINLMNTEDKAKGNLGGIKYQVMNNELMREVFGIRIVKNTETDSVFEHPDGFQTRVLCKGSSQMGSIRGERFGAWRPDLLIGDDIEDDEMVRNVDRRRIIQDDFDSAVEPAVDRESGQIIMIGTILHDDSLIRKVTSLDFYKEYKKLFYRALNVKTGRSLWEDKWSVDDLREIERSSPEKFAKEYQNDPVSGSRASFKREDFRRWEYSDGKVVLYNAVSGVYASYDVSDCVAGIGCDLAWESKRENDETVIMPGLLTPGDEILIDDYVHKRGMRPDEFEDIIFPMVEKYERMTGTTCQIGFEKAKHEKIMKWLLMKAQPKRKKYLMIKDIAWEKDKITRIITALQPRYVNHTVFHKRDMGDLEHQLMRLPDGTHDDLCLIGNTMIKVKDGYKRLDKINAGDLVLTRGGYKKVIRVLKNGKKEVINKFGLIGTPNHPIITKDGIKRLDKLHVYDIIYIWNEKQSFIEEKSITDTLIQREGNIEYTFGDMINGNLRHFRFIDKFGLIILEKFQKVVLCIIEMAIHLITILKTWSASQNLSICDNILQSQNALRFLEKKLRLQVNMLKNGTEVLLEKNGIDNTTIIPSTKQEVYNLTVEDNNEYFANNILVHNCDSAHILSKVLKYPKKKKVGVEVDTHWDWLYNSVTKKREKVPYVFGHKQHTDRFPFKTTKSFS